MRERARSLGIVLDEHLVRDAGRARDELDTLAQVISANLTRAALEAAPVIADLSSWLADVAGKAGIAWERLFDAPEEKSLRTLRYELDLTESTIAKLEGRIQELREFPTLGFTTFIDTAQINALETKLDELRRARDQTQARIAFLEGPPDTGAPAPAFSACSRRHRGCAGADEESGADRARARRHALRHHARGQRADHRRARAADRRDRGAAGQGRQQRRSGRSCAPATAQVSAFPPPTAPRSRPLQAATQASPPGSRTSPTRSLS
jgi:hypothetical protein